MGVGDSESGTGPDTTGTEPPPSAEMARTIAGEQSPDPDRELIPLVERLAGELAGLRRDFDAKIRYDEVKERQIAAMHDELQVLRAGAQLRVLQSVFTDLIAMHDDLTDALTAGDSAPSAKFLESLRESVLETLLRNGVSSYSVVADELDRARQRVIDVEHTTDQTLDRQVARRLRAGFEYDNGKVLRPEWVVVYRHTGTQQPA